MRKTSLTTERIAKSVRGGNAKTCNSSYLTVKRTARSSCCNEQHHDNMDAKKAFSDRDVTAMRKTRLTIKREGFSSPGSKRRVTRPLDGQAYRPSLSIVTS